MMDKNTQDDINLITSLSFVAILATVMGTGLFIFFGI